MKKNYEENDTVRRNRPRSEGNFFPEVTIPNPLSLEFYGFNSERELQIFKDLVCLFFIAHFLDLKPISYASCLSLSLILEDYFEKNFDLSNNAAGVTGSMIILLSATYLQSDVLYLFSMLELTIHLFNSIKESVNEEPVGHLLP